MMKHLNAKKIIHCGLDRIFDCIMLSSTIILLKELVRKVFTYVISIKKLDLVIYFIYRMKKFKYDFVIIIESETDAVKVVNSLVSTKHRNRLH